MAAPALGPTPSFRHALLREAADRLGVDLLEAGRAPEGTRPALRMPTGRGTWARISWHRPGDIFSRDFSGLEASTTVRGVPKPSFVQAVHWLKEGFICRAEEMTFVAHAPVSTGYVVDQDPGLTDSWWEALTSALEGLAATETDRVSLLQDDVDRFIAQVFGTGADTTVEHWTVGHGDLHWANVTAPELFLLDWDSWGLVPRGLDAAKLWEASYRVPGLAAQIMRRFPVLATRDGTISRVWVCATRVLGARKRQEKTGQAEHDLRVGTRLLHDLGR